MLIFVVEDVCFLLHPSGASVLCEFLLAFAVGVKTPDGGGAGRLQVAGVLARGDCPELAPPSATWRLPLI